MSTETAPAQNTQAPASGGPSLDEFVASLGASTATDAAPPTPAGTPAQGSAQPAGAASEAPTPPAGEKPADKPAERPARTPEELYAQIAAKDRLYQEQRNNARQLEAKLQQLQQQQEQLLSRFKSDPLAFAREQGVRFGDLAIAALGGKPEGDDKGDASRAALPPEVQAKLAKLDELEQFVAQTKQEREQAAARAQQETAINAVRGFLGSRDFPMVNDLGLHDQVLARVHAHIGTNGQFADDREAEEMVEFYAREVEQAERAKLLGLAQKPGVKTLLARELGLATQNAASPARPEHQGASVRNPAPLTTRDVQERTQVVPETELTPEQRMQRTLEEISRMKAVAAQGQ